ncbi:MAG: glycosyltransferase [Deltaproteobacteria bacterium]|nr:glycosyltransferase [Deltaproteobacteria bacterium]
MKVLHVSTHDHRGGASVGMHRLHLALHEAGVDSHLAIVEKSGNIVNSHLVGSKVARRVIRPLRIRLEQKLVSAFFSFPPHRAYSTFSFLPSFAYKSLNAFPKDILQVHWVGEGFLPPWAIGRLQGPVIWTLRDTWPFTGGCHFSSTGCMRYRERCGKCPELCSSFEWDVSRWHWLQKYKAVRRIRPVAVALSKEFVEKASRSSILRNCRIEHIPNCIDTDVFKPIPQMQARNILGLPHDKKIVLFGALGATSDYNKGFDLLQKALGHLSDDAHGNLFALVFGASQSDESLPYPTRFLGHLRDAIALNLAYSAADVFICPSRYESFSNTVLESLACGTPVAAFSVGGIPDMLEDRINGCLAPAEDAKALACGIAYILEDGERREPMREAARRVVEERYAAPIIAARYMELYTELLSRPERDAL